MQEFDVMAGSRALPGDQWIVFAHAARVRVLMVRRPALICRRSMLPFATLR